MISYQGMDPGTDDKRMMTMTTMTEVLTALEAAQTRTAEDLIHEMQNLSDHMLRESKKMNSALNPVAEGTDIAWDASFQIDHLESRIVQMTQRIAELRAAYHQNACTIGMLKGVTAI